MALRRVNCQIICATHTHAVRGGSASSGERTGTGLTRVMRKSSSEYCRNGRADPARLDRRNRCGAHVTNEEGAVAGLARMPLLFYAYV